ncbi:MAG TPA: glycosyltransferase family 1 protein, partial [Actinomycetota bacterium]|nr:glycosyltransferase family 1 protein [Actinomycetota bacterium]
GRAGRSPCENPAVGPPASLRAAITLEQSWHRVPGGTAVAALGLARALAKRPGVELVGVAARHAGPAPEPWRPTIPVRHLSLPRVALYESWHRLRRPRVQKATGAVNVIHATTMAIPPRSAPLLVTIHDLAWRRFPQMFTKRGVSFFRRGLALAIKEADLVLCSSEATLRDCAEAGFDETKLRVVPLGVEMAPAEETDVRRVRVAYGLDRPYVLWTGTIEPRKNLAGLLDAFVRLDHNHDLDLVLVGPRGWNEDLDGIAHRVRDRVRMLGFVPASDLGPLYAGAEVFCFPSLLEGFGFPVLEAMSQGTTVVTSRGTSTEELAEGAGVLIDPLDAGSIAEGLEQALEPSLRARLEPLGRARAASFTWERSAQLVASAYEEVA